MPHKQRGGDVTRLCPLGWMSAQAVYYQECWRLSAGHREVQVYTGVSIDCLKIF